MASDLSRAPSGIEIFSRSLHAEDDEEALKWAAIEKLPTFDRIRKGLLKQSLGVAYQVDVQDIGLEDRTNLIQRLVKNGEDDSGKFLLKLRNRIDRVGISLPTIEVRYEKLNIDGQAYTGSSGLPTFINFFVNNLEGFLNYLHILPSKRKLSPILRNISGIIKPCRLTLLLGPPSSGKTTLLLALAGKLDKDLKFSGKVTYNGHGMHEFVPQRTTAYVSQNDVHIGEMTVRETLAFSARCHGVGNRHDMLAELIRREKTENIKPDPDIDIFMKRHNVNREVLLSFWKFLGSGCRESRVEHSYRLKVLGLDVCADILVGNNMLRGISGGQRKRVTTGEMLVGTAKVLLMDEISTGLDSLTTFQIVKSLSQYVHTFEETAVISLLQPAPETYDLFDDIILLSDGQIVYQGPREHVLPFFESMGFKCPERKGAADFLQEVTSKKDQEQYWSRYNELYRFVTAHEFSEAFNSFHVGQRFSDELAIPFEKEKSHPAALTTTRYGASKKELFKACASRELLLMKRNSFVYIFKLMKLIILGFVAMTVYFRTKMHRNSITDGEVYAGSLFFGIVVLLFSGSAEVPMTVVKLPVFHKQRDLFFFPSWAYAISTWVVKIPISCFEVALWVALPYYVIGYDPNVGRFFKQYLLLLVFIQMTSGLFRLIASGGRDMLVAQTFGMLFMVLVLALGGFIISRENIKPWWIWGYWISPVMYVQNAVLVNEFLGAKWSIVPPMATEQLGVSFLKSRGFFAEEYWFWLGVGALLIFIFIFNFFNIVALTFLNPLGKTRTVMPEETESNVYDVELNNSAEKTNPKAREDHIQRGNISQENSCTKRITSVGADGSRRRGMILPFEQHSIAFEDIVYSVDMPQEMKNQGAADDRLVLLNGVSGAFRPGVLTALMGASGAGKTTLMDVLAGRKTGGYIEGNMSISGYPKQQETYARISGYCEQNDIHSPHVTVYESLLYSAWLRLPPEVDFETRKLFIKEVMELVELTPLKEALVGLPGVNGLSTEQRKRLTIAVELVANPSIIFMDEPTSGLDARAAAIVMRTVRNTVDTGRTVVCTIHQPGIDIFEAFDELLLLKRGGQEIYVGPLGRYSCHLINYFEGFGGVNKIKDGINPASWMLEVTNSAQELLLGVDFSDLYKSSELYRRNKALIKELSSPRPGSKDLYFPTEYSQSFFTQCLACLWKQNLSYWRNPLYTAVRFLFTILIALMLGTIFWGLGSKRSNRQDIFNAMGSMFCAVSFLGAQNASTVQPVVDVERTVFYRERAAGMYSAMSYAFAQVTIELPYIFVQTATYCIMVYAMMGFEWTATKFLWNLYFMYFTLLYFTFYGMMTVSVTPNQNIAAIVSTAFYGLWNLFSGFIVPRPRIPVWWRWYYWACPVAWTLYGLVESQYGDVTEMMADTNETVEEFMKSYFGYRHDFIGVVAVVVAGLPVIFAFIFAFCIKKLNFQKR